MRGSYATSSSCRFRFLLFQPLQGQEEKEEGHGVHRVVHDDVSGASLIPVSQSSMQTHDASKGLNGCLILKICPAIPHSWHDKLCIHLSVMLLVVRLEFSLPISPQGDGVADTKILSLRPHASSSYGTVTVKVSCSDLEGGQRIMEYLDGASHEWPVCYCFPEACPKIADAVVSWNWLVHQYHIAPYVPPLICRLAAHPLPVHIHHSVSFLDTPCISQQVSRAGLKCSLF